MPHLRPEALDAFSEQTLNAGQREQVEQHLFNCPICSETYVKLERERQALGAALRQIRVPALRRPAAELVASLVHEPESKATLTPASSAQLIPSPAGLLRHISWTDLRKGLPWAFVGAAALLCVVLCAHLLGQLEHQQTQAQSAFEDLRQEIRAQAERADALQRERDEAQAVAQKLIREELNLRIQDESAQQARDREGERAWLDTRMTELQSKLDEAKAKHDSAREDAAQLQARLDAERIRLEETLHAQALHRDVLAGEVNALNEKLENAKQVRAEPKEKILNLLDDEALRLVASLPKDNVLGIPLKNAEKLRGWVRALQAQDNPQGAGVIQQLVNKPVPGNGIQRGTSSFAAPLVLNGRVYVGDGTSGSQFFAYDAVSGKHLWTFRASDPGVGPPVATEDGATIFFTTESCTLYGVDARTGLRRWSRWLGNTSMTQPALSKDKLVVVHTDGAGRGVGTGRSTYAISCMEVRNGAVLWTNPLPADCVTSPVIEGNWTCVTTRDGKVSTYDLKTGKPGWVLDEKATSAPVIFDGRAFFTSWKFRNNGFEEGLFGVDLEKPRAPQAAAGPFPASYLGNFAEGASPPQESYEDPRLEANANPAKGQAPINQVAELGNVWSHMGARPTVVGQEAYLALGDRLVSTDLRTGRVNWNLKVKGAKGASEVLNSGQPALTPPAAADGNLYLGSAWGDVLCVEGATGKQLWRYRVPGDAPVVSQIVMEKGRFFAVTASGLLICIDTGDENVTGWGMWGGSPSHNSAR